jgi:hypothetical protein
MNTQNLTLAELTFSIAEINENTNFFLIAKRMMEANAKKEISIGQLEILLIAFKNKCSKYGHNL